MRPGDDEAHRYDINRDEMLPFVPVNAQRLLDVGASTGRFAAALRCERPELELWAIEPNPERAAVAAPHFDEILLGDYPNPSIPRDYFDVVMFNDVLEHMAEPVDALHAAKQSLRAGGVVVASIPNVRHRSVVMPLIIRGDFRYEDTGILDRTHLRFYTRRTIGDLFVAGGFCVDALVGINPKWHWADDTLRRRGRWVRAISRSRFDDFLFVQYVIIARPAV